MKPLIPILVVATTSLAVASVQLAQQASTQRKRADSEVQLRQTRDARVAELERNQVRLEQELAMVRGQRGGEPALALNPPRAAGMRAEPGTSAAVDGVMPPGPPPPPFEIQRRGPMESTAARNFMRTRMKSSVRRLYGDAGQALGLSSEKSKQLLDLLADQQSRGFGRGGGPRPDGQSIQQYVQEQQKKNNDEIQAIIGADKADEWATYQKSLPQRSELGAVRDQLEQAGVPMTDSQRTDMLAAITEEQQRLPRPTYTSGVAPEESMAQMNQWQTEYNKALTDRAKQVLNTEQYTAYKEYQDWQAEMRNNMPRPPNGMVMRSFSSSSGEVAMSSGVAVGGPIVNFQTVEPMQALPMPPPPNAAPQRK